MRIIIRKLYILAVGIGLLLSPATKGESFEDLSPIKIKAQERSFGEVYSLDLGPILNDNYKNHIKGIDSYFSRDSSTLTIRFDFDDEAYAKLPVLEFADDKEKGSFLKETYLDQRDLSVSINLVFDALDDPIFGISSDGSCLEVTLFNKEVSGKFRGISSIVGNLSKTSKAIDDAINAYYASLGLSYDTLIKPIGTQIKKRYNENTNEIKSDWRKFGESTKNTNNPLKIFGYFFKAAFDNYIHSIKTNLRNTGELAKNSFLTLGMVPIMFSRNVMVPKNLYEVFFTGEIPVRDRFLKAHLIIINGEARAIAIVGSVSGAISVANVGASLWQTFVSAYWPKFTNLLGGLSTKVAVTPDGTPFFVMGGGDLALESTSVAALGLKESVLGPVTFMAFSGNGSKETQFSSKHTHDGSINIIPDHVEEGSIIEVTVGSERICGELISQNGQKLVLKTFDGIEKTFSSAALKNPKLICGPIRPGEQMYMYTSRGTVKLGEITRVKGDSMEILVGGESIPILTKNAVEVHRTFTGTFDDILRNGSPDFLEQFAGKLGFEYDFAPLSFKINECYRLFPDMIVRVAEKRVFTLPFINSRASLNFFQRAAKGFPNADPFQKFIN